MRDQRVYWLESRRDLTKPWRHQCFAAFHAATFSRPPFPRFAISQFVQIDPIRVPSPHSFPSLPCLPWSPSLLCVLRISPFQIRLPRRCKKPANKFPVSVKLGLVESPVLWHKRATTGVPVSPHRLRLGQRRIACICSPPDGIVLSHLNADQQRPWSAVARFRIGSNRQKPHCATARSRSFFDKRGWAIMV